MRCAWLRGWGTGGIRAMDAQAAFARQIEAVIAREIQTVCRPVPPVPRVPRLLRLPDGASMGYSLTPMLSDDPITMERDGRPMQLIPGVLQVDMVRSTLAVPQPLQALEAMLKTALPGRRFGLMDDATLALRGVQQVRPDRQRGEIHYVTLTLGLRVTAPVW
ncbi:MAG: hypothetical protein AAF092_15810 [Pseudomonadota bacterium]